MSGSEMWAIAVTALLSIIGGILLVIYKEMTRRLDKVEKKAAAVLVAVLVIIGKSPDVSPELLRAVQASIAD